MRPPEDPAISGRKPQSIRGALVLMRAVAAAGPGVRVSELVARTGLSQATTYRLIAVLEADGYLVRLPGFQGLALGAAFEEIVDLVAPSLHRPTPEAALTGLRSELSHAVSVVGFEVARPRHVCLDPAHPMADRLTAPDLRRTAAGRLLLIEAGNDWRSLVAAGAEADDQPAPALLESELRAAAERGYTRQNDELEAGVGCLAVPLRAQDGRLLGGVVASGDSDRLKRETDFVVQRLERAAGALLPMVDVPGLRAAH